MISIYLIIHCFNTALGTSFIYKIYIYNSSFLDLLSLFPPLLPHIPSFGLSLWPLVSNSFVADNKIYPQSSPTQTALFPNFFPAIVLFIVFSWTSVNQIRKCIGLFIGIALSLYIYTKRIDTFRILSHLSLIFLFIGMSFMGWGEVS